MKPSSPYTRATSFAILVISLVAVLAGLLGLWFVLMNQAGRGDPEKQKYVVRLAAVVFAVAVLTIIILVGVVARYIAQRFTNPPEPFKPTPYENAWKEAGRRLKPEDAPPVEGFEDQDEDDQDEEDQDDEAGP